MMFGINFYQNNRDLNGINDMAAKIQKQYKIDIRMTIHMNVGKHKMYNMASK